MRQFWADVDAAWVGFRITTEEFQGLDGQILVLGRAFARGWGSGITLDVPAAWMAGLRNRRIVDFRSFSSQQDALEAAGCGSRALEAARFAPHPREFRERMREPEAQYQRPRTKPPNAISPMSAMINPSQKLQTNATTIPTITRMPPRDIPPIPPVRRSGVAILAVPPSQ
jgi:hypothetical protein